jgi:imidazolonepropionase-like amidohydrolase
LKLLVKYGRFTPLEAIEAATRVNAQVLGLAKEFGTVEEGKHADLVVVQGNPLDDIGLLLNRDNVHLVVQGGKIVKDTLG